MISFFGQPCSLHFVALKSVIFRLDFMFGKVCSFFLTCKMAAGMSKHIGALRSDIWFKTPTKYTVTCWWFHQVMVGSFCRKIMLGKWDYYSAVIVPMSHFIALIIYVLDMMHYAVILASYDWWQSETNNGFSIQKTKLGQAIHLMTAVTSDFARLPVHARARPSYLQFEEHECVCLKGHTAEDIRTAILKTQNRTKTKNCRNQRTVESRCWSLHSEMLQMLYVCF